MISKDFAFSASHQLEGLPDDHPCSRLHGHNYRVRVCVEAAELDPVGFVVDYGELKGFGAWIDRELDHRHLNDVLIDNPTAENLARTLHAVLFSTVSVPAGATEVGVSETPKTWAWYRR